MLKTEKNNIDFFRAALGIYLLVYNLEFSQRLDYIFGASGMVDRKLLGLFFNESLLFYVKSPLFLYAAYGCLLTLSFLFAIGQLSRALVGVLFILNISFHHANPYIIHEPQQITNFLLLAYLLFLPTKRGERAPSDVVRMLIVCLGVYYFIAGLKKIPDPNWQMGLAVGKIATWSTLQKGSWGEIIYDSPWLNGLFTYATLAFEILFLPIYFLGFNRVLFASAVVLHIGIWLSLDVGSFSFIMLVWCMLLMSTEKFEVLMPEQAND